MTAPNKKIAREQARLAVNNWAIRCACDIVLIPFALDPITMTTGNITLVIQVGAIFGVDMDRTGAWKLFTAVAAPIFTKLDYLIFFPDCFGLGRYTKFIMAIRVIKSSGEALIHYFNDCSELPESLIFNA